MSKKERPVCNGFGQPRRVVQVDQDEENCQRHGHDLQTFKSLRVHIAPWVVRFPSILEDDPQLTDPCHRPSVAGPELAFVDTVAGAPMDDAAPKSIEVVDRRVSDG